MIVVANHRDYPAHMNTNLDLSANILMIIGREWSYASTSKALQF